MGKIRIKNAIEEIKRKLSDQSIEKISEDLTEINDAAYDMDQELKEALSEKDDAESKAEDQENEASESRNELDNLKEEIGPLNTENEYDAMKRKVIVRLFKNLNLEQVENLEETVKTSFKSNKKHYIEDVF